MPHSHAFRGSRQRASWRLHEVVEAYQTRYAAHPRELLDIICVADCATLPLGKYLFLGGDLSSEQTAELRRVKASALVETIYVIHDEDTGSGSVERTGAILAGLVHELTFRMAFSDVTIREWADHLSHLGFYGGIGRPVFWTEDQLSAEVRTILNKSGRSNERWSKWCKHLP